MSKESWPEDQKRRKRQKRRGQGNVARSLEKAGEAEREKPEEAEDACLHARADPSLSRLFCFSAAFFSSSPCLSP